MFRLLSVRFGQSKKLIAYDSTEVTVTPSTRCLCNPTRVLGQASTAASQLAVPALDDVAWCRSRLAAEVAPDAE